MLCLAHKSKRGFRMDRGHGMGTRVIDELLAKSSVGSCADFRETAEVIAKVGFKMFLGVTAGVSGWTQDDTEFSLIRESSPWESMHKLNFSIMYAYVTARILSLVP